MMKTFAKRVYKKIENQLSGKGLDKYVIVRKSAGFVRSRLKSNSATINGHIMYLDSEDSLRLSINRIYEELETALVKKLVKKEDVVIDLGANIGYYTLIFAKLVGKKGKVYAFEPESDNFDILKKNVNSNGYQNVVLIQKAVLNKEKKINMYVLKDNKGSHRIDKPSRGEFNIIQIIATSLDKYFEDSEDKINFIKMDVEGSESKVINGMKKVLEKTKNLIIMTEFSPHAIKKSGMLPEEFIKILNENDFEVFHINRRKSKLVPLEINQLLQEYNVERENHTNLLCVKGNRLVEVKKICNHKIQL